MFSGCVMAAGAGGAGSIFQGAQHEAGENSGVGPLPADINIVEPPSDYKPSATSAYDTKSQHYRYSSQYKKVPWDLSKSRLYFCQLKSEAPM